MLNIFRASNRNVSKFKMKMFSDSFVGVMSLWTLLLGCFNNPGFRAGIVIVRAESDTVKVSAVVGSDVSLPCETRSTQSSDILLLVVWYKDNVPLYSYDGRIKGPSAHWADEALSGRARWHAAAPSSLRIHDVQPTDRATYHCRVDFKISPTRNHKIRLEIIELPEKPKIFDGLKEVVGVAGPYIEDSSIKLTCVVTGGKPMPRLRWLRNDKVITTLAPLEDGYRFSLLELKIPKLTRDYFEAVYTCSADNTVLVPSQRVNVQIQLYLRPLFVEILARDQPLVVGKKGELACKTAGARPPAAITWWLDNRQITSKTLQESSDDKNETVSVLRWTPRMEEDGQVLTCRATHVKLEHIMIETNITLNLHYAPIVDLQLGSKLNPNDIEEGDDVYFECNVKSNPPPYKVVWEHDGQVMTHNQRAGIIAGSAHLALQSVNRRQAGQYACTASNVEGDGKSQFVHLQVIYKPNCKISSTVIVGAAINEPTKVTCEVDGFPVPKNFQWILNNSMGSIEIETDKFSVDAHGRSVLSYTPTTERDYGSLACRATNLAGQQMEPCRYSLLPAVRPDRLSNCVSVNLTEDSLEIKCVAGYDGGLRTSYFVEVWETKQLKANVSTHLPAWILRGLGPGKVLKLVFYAYNARGRSEPTSLRINTLSRLVSSTDGKPGIETVMSTRWALVVIGLIVGLFIIIISVTIITRRSRNLSLEYEARSATRTYKDGVQSVNNSPVPPDDKNPDVVPLSKVFTSVRDIQRQPEPPPYGSVLSPPVESSRSAHNLYYQELRSVIPNINPAYDTQSVGGGLSDDRRVATSGPYTSRREIVTTRTPLLANTRESCV